MKRYVPAIALAGLLLGGGAGCAAPYNDISALSERGYKGFLRVSESTIWLHAPESLRLPQSSEVVVQVRDAQGQPVDGIPVRFAVEPSWASYTALTPAEMVTRRGEARALFQASTTGVVPVMAHLDTITLHSRITVISRPTIGDGGS
ncbi:MAG: hypothetical protein AB7N91_17185 [Candidatus Tectimicrobiota bacterium]